MAHYFVCLGITFGLACLVGLFTVWAVLLVIVLLGFVYGCSCFCSLLLV